MEEIQWSTKSLEMYSEYESYNFLEIRIKDFLKDAEPKIKTGTPVYNENANFYAYASVSVWPNAADKETQGWVLVLPEMKLCFNSYYHTVDEELSCIVSIIDIEGSFRFPRHFEGHLDRRDDEDFSKAKYVKRSAILDRADELLPKGVLTLRCDFRIVKPYYSYTLDHFFIHNLRKPQRIIVHYNGKKDHEVILYDFTMQNLAMTKKRFIVESIPPVVLLLNPDSKADRDVLEHVWVFYSDSVMVLLCLDEKMESVGSRLLKASPVIRRMVNTDLKERREKRFKIQENHIEAFIYTLILLQIESIQPLNIYYHDTTDNLEFLRPAIFGDWDFRELYKFSHFYLMEELQMKCAEELVRSVLFSTEELREIAESYSDKYLSKLLESHHLEDDHWQQPRQQLEARLNFQCYI